MLSQRLLYATVSHGSNISVINRQFVMKHCTCNVTCIVSPISYGRQTFNLSIAVFTRNIWKITLSALSSSVGILFGIDLHAFH